MRALEFITGHVIYNPAYTYKFKLKTTMYVSYIEIAFCLQCGAYPTRAFVYRSDRQLAC